MKKPRKENLSYSRPRNITHKCSVCGLVSKDVHKSIKYKDYFCKDCLVSHILQS